MIKIGNILFALLFPLLVNAQTKVVATVDHNEMGAGQTVTLTVSVSSGESISIGEPTLPSMPDFELLNKWEGMDSRSVFSNGTFQFLRTQKFNFQLRALKTGNLTIGAVDVPVNGKSMKTQPIVIKVHNGALPNHPPAGNDADEEEDSFNEADRLFQQLLQRRGMVPTVPSKPINPNEAFTIQLDLDKTQVYQGEQITASWFLVVPEGNSVTAIDTLKYPTLRGFWKEDIEVTTNLNFQSVVINGRPFRKALLVSYALFPIKDGTIEIDPYQAKCDIVGQGFMGMGNKYTFTKASLPVKVKVLPLPTGGKPNDFAGIVGDFNLRADVGAKQVPANQPFSFKVRLEGEGNAKSMEKPALQLPPSLELYDTKEETKFFTTGKSFKEFEFLLIPREMGKINLPTVSVSFFNPKKNSYVQRKTEAMSVEVVASRSENQVNNSPLSQLTGTKEATKVVEKLTLPGVYAVWQPGGISQGKRLTIWLFVLFICLLITVWMARRELGLGQKKRSLGIKLDSRIKIVRQKIEKDDYRAVGAELTNLISSILGEMVGDKGAGQEVDKLIALLPPSVRAGVAAPLEGAVAKVSALSFAPEAILGDLKEKAKMKELASAVEKILRDAIAQSETDVSGDVPERGPLASS